MYWLAFKTVDGTVVSEYDDDEQVYELLNDPTVFSVSAKYEAKNLVEALRKSKEKFLTPT